MGLHSFPLCRASLVLVAAFFVSHACVAVDPLEIDTLVLYSQKAMCSHAEIPICGAGLRIDDEREVVDPDLAFLDLTFNDEYVTVRVGFYDSPVDIGTIAITLSGDTYERLSFDSSGSFELLRDSDGNESLETLLYSGSTQTDAAGSVELEFPTELLPNIQRKKVWVFALASTDRMPDRGSIGFPARALRTEDGRERDEHQGYLDPDLSYLRMAYTTESILVEVGFHSQPLDMGTVLVFLKGETYDRVRFDASGEFELHRDADGNESYETFLHSGVTETAPDGLSVKFEFPSDLLPDIYGKQVRIYAINSMDYIPDSGRTRFPAPEQCCDELSPECRLAIETEIVLNAQLTNAAFALSGVGAVLKLVNVIRMDGYVHDIYFDDEQEEDIEGALDYLVGHEEEIESGLGYSETHGPDITAYFIDKHYSHAGINGAFNRPNGIFVVTRDAAHQYEFTHSVGHLFGLEHDHAFCQPTETDGRRVVPCFKTLMADHTACTCTMTDDSVTEGSYVSRVLLFSSPDLNWSNIPVYDGGMESSVAALQAALPLVAARRQSTGQVWAAPDIAAGKTIGSIVVLYEHEAMCLHAVGNLPVDCENNRERRNAIKTEAMINIHLTNAFFVLSKVNVYVKYAYMGFWTETKEIIAEHMGNDDYETIRDYFCAHKYAKLKGAVYSHTWDNGGGIGPGISPDEFDFNRNSKHQYVFTHELGHRLEADHEESFCHIIDAVAPCFKTIMGEHQNRFCLCKEENEDGAITLADTNYVPRIGRWANLDLQYQGIQLGYPDDDTWTGTREDIENEALSDFEPCDPPYCEINPDDCFNSSWPNLFPDRCASLGLCLPSPEVFCERFPEVCDEGGPNIRLFLDPMDVDFCDVYPYVCQVLCEEYPHTCFREFPLLPSSVAPPQAPNFTQPPETSTEPPQSHDPPSSGDPPSPDPPPFVPPSPDSPSRDPPSRDPPSRDLCFSGQSLVEVEGGSKNRIIRRMDELNIGDSVLTTSGTSRVYSFGHYDTKTATEFLQIRASCMDALHPLEISPHHLIYTQDGATKAEKIVAAGDLKVGDYLMTRGEPSAIFSIRAVKRNGAFSPLTFEGTLIVNGVVASNYVSREWLKSWVAGDLLHFFQHGGVAPYRLFCSLFGCQEEAYDETTGFSAWVQFWYRVEQWQLRRLGRAARATFLSFFAVLALFSDLVGKLLSFSTSTVVTHLIAAYVGGYLVWNKNGKKCPNCYVGATGKKSKSPEPT